MVEPSSAAADKGYVLVVDDDRDCRNLLTALVTRAGYRSAAVPDGNSALESVGAEAPDLILLDAHLPDIDGFSICRSLKGKGAAPAIIILTAFASDESRERSKQSGANEFMAKPFRAGPLLAMISNLMPQGAGT